MPEQLDWIGGGKRRLKDVRNTNPTVAEEKARLLLRLGELINNIPPKLKTGGSVDDVRNWKRVRAEAAKVAGNSRSSVTEIGIAIGNMERLFAVEE